MRGGAGVRQRPRGRTEGRGLCVFISAVPITKLFAWESGLGFKARQGASWHIEVLGYRNPSRINVSFRSTYIFFNLTPMSGFKPWF